MSTTSARAMEAARKIISEILGVNTYLAVDCDYTITASVIQAAMDAESSCGIGEVTDPNFAQTKPEIAAGTVHSFPPRRTPLPTQSAGRVMGLCAIPVELGEANEFVRKHHRHHGRVVGHKFSIGATLGETIVGVVIVGRPVARGRDDGLTLEVTRLCSDGTKNACSFLYGAAARAAFALGYKRLGTYILASENGASLRASGWRQIAEVKGRSWTTPSRPRVDKHPTQGKLLFEIARNP